MKITKEVIAKLIKEAIHDRLRNIDEAGDAVAKEAKIAKLDEERNIVEAAKSHFEAAANILKEYVNPKSINMIMKEIDTCLKEIEATKNRLSGIKKEKVTPVAKGAAPKKAEQKPAKKA